MWPPVRTYPATACIFVGSFLTIVFGVLNLIMALVVHSFQDNDRASEATWRLRVERVDQADGRARFWTSMHQPDIPPESTRYAHQDLPCGFKRSPSLSHKMTRVSFSFESLGRLLLPPTPSIRLIIHLRPSPNTGRLDETSPPVDPGRSGSEDVGKPLRTPGNRPVWPEPGAREKVLAS